MTRHYGLQVGDRVRFKLFGRQQVGTVTELFVTDNNGGRIRLDDGNEMNIVCEWCDVLPKLERCPDCGEPVHSIFDHVDRDRQCNVEEETSHDL